jgi:hypothetical protein
MSVFHRLSLLCFMVVSLLLGNYTAASAATNAYDAKYVTSISYMNIGTVPANLNVVFYATTGTSVAYQLIDANGGARVIPANASASLSVSTVSDLSSAGKYSAVVTSNQPLIATVMQVANDSIIGTDPISNALRASDASLKVALPAVMKGCFADDLTTKFAIQNTTAASLSDVTYSLKWANGDDAFVSSAITIPAGGVEYVDLASVSIGSKPAGVTLPTGCAFSGAAFVESATGALAVTAVELSGVNKYGSSFEGQAGTTADGATTIFMPSAMCRVNYGDGEQTSTYAIQNLTNGVASVDVAYKYQVKSGGTWGAVTNKTLSIDVPAYGKVSVSGCDASKNAMGNVDTATGQGMPPASAGSAKITSTAKIVAVQKVNGGGLSSSTPGIISSSSTVYTPFVRYTTSCFAASPAAAVCRGESRQRTFFAVQNTGGATVKVRMKLYNYKGEEVATLLTANVLPDAKVSIDPSKATASTGHTAAELAEFGYAVVSGAVLYSGSAVFESVDPTTLAAASTIGVVARVVSMSPLGQTGDDYNGTPQ